MTLHYSDPWLTVHLGDCRAVMASMDPESVHCVVTSPPYWGLRDYGTASWEGGDEACDHKPDFVPRSDRPNTGLSNIGRGGDYNDRQDEGARAYRDTCRKCGARRIDQQLGLEPTPEAYVEAMVAVFREVRRVLRSDGTVWLNLGDSYATGAGSVGERPGGGAQGDAWNGHRRSRGGSAKQPHTGAPIGPMTQPNRMPQVGLKPKDLVGIPWRVAFALQADGWYLRSDIIWAKPNPMPESVTDRPTKSHEYVFLLSKSARYWYDADAVREDGTGRTAGNRGPVKGAGNDDPFFRTREGFEKVADKPWTARNLRSVWTVATQPYPGAHFATFPPKLIEPCIKAGCPEGGTVLDPFAGSGTTAMVATRLSRRAVLIDLNADYLGQVMDRNRALPLGLETA